MGNRKVLGGVWWGVCEKKTFQAKDTWVQCGQRLAWENVRPQYSFIRSLLHSSSRHVHAVLAGCQICPSAGLEQGAAPSLCLGVQGLVGEGAVKQWCRPGVVLLAWRLNECLHWGASWAVEAQDCAHGRNRMWGSVKPCGQGGAWNLIGLEVMPSRSVQVVIKINKLR
jgi:hypothetical protein